MKKELVQVLTCVSILTLLMTGCGKENSIATIGNKTNENYFFSELFTEKDVSIWYDCKEIDKENKPNVFVMYGDGTYISAKEYSFGELSRMSDEEIVSWAENNWAEKCKIRWAYEHYMDYKDDMMNVADSLGYGQFREEYYCDCVYWYSENRSYPDYLDTLNYLAFDEFVQNKFNNLDDYWTELDENIDELLDNKALELPTEQPYVTKSRYGFSIYTDSSGNNAEIEIICLEADSNKEFDCKSSPSNGIVYESLYAGWHTINDSFFLTRCANTDITVAFDEIGTEGILIDESMKFE